MDFVITTAEKLGINLPGYIPYVLQKICVDDPMTFVYSVLKPENQIRFVRNFKETFAKISNGSIPISSEGREEFIKLKREYGSNAIVQPAILVKLEAIAYALNNKYKIITVRVKEEYAPDSSSSESEQE